MTLKSENGWPVLDPTSHLLRTFVIPTKEGDVHLRMRDGSVGFVLAFFVSLYAQYIEAVVGKILDDWGYAYRPVRGSITPSNHASGTAVDLNATRHPLGKVGTLAKAALLLRTLLAGARLRGLLRWGGDYHGRKDEMHTEAAPGTTIADFEKRARVLVKTKRGKAILAANPGLLAVINS